MSLLIDAHLHIFETSDVGSEWKDSYDIWEYGANSVPFSRYAGDITDARSAIAEASYDHAVFANVFFPRIEVDFALRSLPPEATEDERQRAADQVRAAMPARMFERNRWGCELVAGDTRFSVLAGIDPTVVSPEENVSLIRTLVADYGIKGIKIHPPLQSFWPSDHRMLPVYRVCEELGLVVLSHTGSAKGSENFGAPSSFAPVLQGFPRLKLQLAHLGGGEWREATSVGQAHEQVFFDLCEIIDWVGSPGAPTMEEMARMIKEIGPARVLMGTDFPWYDLDVTAQRVSELPILSKGEKEAIAGDNAAAFYDLAI